MKARRDTFVIHFIIPHHERGFTHPPGHALAVGRVKGCWIDALPGEAGMGLMSSFGRAEPLPAPRPGMAGGQLWTSSRCPAL